MSLGRKVSEKVIELQAVSSHPVHTGQLAVAPSSDLPDLIQQQDLMEDVQLAAAIDKAIAARRVHRAWLSAALAAGVPVERGAFSARRRRLRNGVERLEVA